MARGTDYIYGIDSGNVYWQGNDTFHYTYRYAITGDRDWPCADRDAIDAWTDGLDEDIFSVKTRLGKIGVKIDRIRRIVRRRLNSVKLTRHSITQRKSVPVSLLDVCEVYAARLFVLTGVLALTAAFTALDNPFNLCCGESPASAMPFF